jgi:2-dehydropantoate 2-reductase
VVAVARAAGVRLEKVSGTLDLEWVALTDSERHVAGSPSLFTKHALILAVGARFRRMRSSMLAAIERGRPPAVDFLNGEVVTRGKRLGVPTPINEAVRDQVLQIARGKAKPGLALIRSFFDLTRALVTPEALASARESLLLLRSDLVPPNGGASGTLADKPSAAPPPRADEPSPDAAPSPAPEAQEPAADAEAQAPTAPEASEPASPNGEQPTQ